MAELCPTAVEVIYNRKKLPGEKVPGPCRFLSWGNGDARACSLFRTGEKSAKELGIGKGCCIAARIVMNVSGRTMEVQFASLPAGVKNHLAALQREKLTRGT
jgi:hypothetical protein